MPLDPDDISRLRDVMTYAGKVQAMVDGLSQASFMSDTKTFFAVCYGIQVVGEAAWKLSEGMKMSHTTIPWPLPQGAARAVVTGRDSNTSAVGCTCARKHFFTMD